jgi:hypothetical protein
MKFKLLLCGAALLVAGCSSPPNPFASSAEYPYAYDSVPQPVADHTPVDLDKLYLLPPPAAADSSSGALSRNSGASDYGDR